MEAYLLSGSWWPHSSSWWRKRWRLGRNSTKAPWDRSGKAAEEDELLSTWFVRDEYINAGWFKRILLTIQFLFRDTHGKTGYQDPEAFARYYEAQKENYVGLQSEHTINAKVYHVTNYLDRSKEATAFDKIDELIDRNRWRLWDVTLLLTFRKTLDIWNPLW